MNPRSASASAKCVISPTTSRPGADQLRHVPTGPSPCRASRGRDALGHALAGDDELQAGLAGGGDLRARSSGRARGCGRRARQAGARGPRRRSTRTARSRRRRAPPARRRRRRARTRRPSPPPTIGAAEASQQASRVRADRGEVDGEAPSGPSHVDREPVPGEGDGSPVRLQPPAELMEVAVPQAVDLLDVGEDDQAAPSASTMPASPGRWPRSGGSDGRGDQPLTGERVVLADPHRQHGEIATAELGREGASRTSSSITRSRAPVAVEQLERVDVVGSETEGAHAHVAESDRRRRRRARGCGSAALAP